MNKIIRLVLITIAFFTVSVSAYAAEEIVDEMRTEIKTVVEEVNDYMSIYNLSNTDKGELLDTYSRFAAAFDRIKIAYSPTNFEGIKGAHSATTLTDGQKDSYDELIRILDIAIYAMSKYSEGFKSTGLKSVSVLMDGATKWQEVNEFFGIELE